MNSLWQSPTSRRAFLRTGGITLALPWLEAFAPVKVRADQPGTPGATRRMAALFMPNGVHQDHWTPQGEGADFNLSSTLEPLADLKQQLLILTQLWNQGSRSGDGHYVKASGFLTGTTITKTLGVDLNCNGISIDQMAAQQIGHLTPLPSLELGTEPASTGVDTTVGYTRVYGSHISWAGPTRPLAKETNPRLVFERLLRATRSKEVGIQRERSFLDLVLEETRSLQKNLGPTDRRRVEEYLDSVRSVEQRLQHASKRASNGWSPRVEIHAEEAPPEKAPDAHAEHVKLMLDMIVLAFQADMTRIATFMFGNAVSNKNFSFLEGVKGAHHSISHHQGKEDQLEQYQRINRWHVEQYGYLLQRLADLKEGEQSILDQSMILFGSALRDGNSHNPHNLPIVLAGGAGGRLDTGHHRVYAKDTPLCNLYVSMLEAFGTPVERFADSTGPLPGVLKA